jgi:contactin associated protein-like 2
VGGGLHGEAGFIGCLRNLVLDGELKESEDWTSLSSELGVEMGGCSLKDHCLARPCQQGRCLQNFTSFRCDCEGTGYSGAVCAVSLHYRSCTQYLEATGYTGEAHQVMVDLDGSGPFPPVSVTCRLRPDGQAETVVRHDNEEATKVDGFQEAGSFQQAIHYQAAESAVVALVLGSQHCSQALSYDCLGSRLLEGWAEGRPWGWWVARWAHSLSYNTKSGTYV